MYARVNIQPALQIAARQHHVIARQQALHSGRLAALGWRVIHVTKRHLLQRQVTLGLIRRALESPHLQDSTLQNQKHLR